MLFILPQKKRFGESSWQQIGCCIGFLALLLGLNLLNQQQSGLDMDAADGGVHGHHAGNEPCAAAS